MGKGVDTAFLRLRSCFMRHTGVRRGSQGADRELLAFSSGRGDGWGGGVERMGAVKAKEVQGTDGKRKRK